jgi:hypothetical protein
MLYGSDAFSDNGLPTMVVKEPYTAEVGNNWGINHRGQAGLRGLSKGDVRGVIAMYDEPADRDPNLDLNQFVTAGAPLTPPRALPSQSQLSGEALRLGAPPVSTSPKPTAPVNKSDKPSSIRTPKASESAPELPVHK